MSAQARPRVRGVGGAVAVAAIVILVAAGGRPLHAQSQPGMAVTAAASNLEGRPPISQVSPLQARVDAAAAGSTIAVAPGEYTGDLYIDHALHLVGANRPRLVGSGAGSVVRVRADNVVIEGFDIDGKDGGSLNSDSAGIHVAAKHVRIRDCHIVHSLFGVYLREADDAIVERVVVDGEAGKDPGDQGSGFHLWNTNGFVLRGNRVHNSRDGFYLQNASNGLVSNNVASDVRYGLHYMFSDDNTFEDNTFERSAAGAALMYSKHLVFRRNRFLHNRGFTSVGLLMQACDDVLAEDNLIADNARGIFLEGTHRDIFRGNIIADSDQAIVMCDSTVECRFEGNSFLGNLSPLQLVGRRSDTVFSGNFWSDDDEPDLDGDGLRDRPYRLSNVFDHMRGNLTAADLFAQGFAADVLGRAEKTFPVLSPIPVVDARPLARPPALPHTPSSPATSHGSITWGLAASLAGLFAGSAVLLGGRRPRHAPGGHA